MRKLRVIALVDSDSDVWTAWRYGLGCRGITGCCRTVCSPSSWMESASEGINVDAASLTWCWAFWAVLPRRGCRERIYLPKGEANWRGVGHRCPGSPWVRCLLNRLCSIHGVNGGCGCSWLDTNYPSFVDGKYLGILVLLLMRNSFSDMFLSPGVICHQHKLLSSFLLLRFFSGIFFLQLSFAISCENFMNSTYFYYKQF